MRSNTTTESLIEQPMTVKSAPPPYTRDADHLMEGELRGPPDYLEGFLRIGDTGQLDNDAILPRALQTRLGDSQLVDAPA